LLGAFVSVQGFFVWWCLLRRVMYQCYFFLYDIAVLLLLFKKMAAHGCVRDFVVGGAGGSWIFQTVHSRVMESSNVREAGLWTAYDE
jgi:hypothetical protein